MTAPEVRVREVRLYEWPFVLRLPFRFGAITVTHGRQAVLRLRLSLADGREGWGVAAETLAAKWFDKDPKIADDDNVDQLRAALEIASDIYQRNGARTPYGHFVSAYGPQISAGVRRRLNPLVASFGPALLDRAIADAVGKLLGLSFYDLARKNVLGLRPTPATPDLPGFDFDRFLAGLAPSATIHARHTVGMVDPITAADQAPGTRVEDGLPETLEDIVATYGHRYYKLKVGGNVAADIARLTRIAAVLDRQSHRYHATLDGNEQYGDAAAVLELWKAIEATPALSRLRQSILFVEQPIRRARALAESVDALAARVPVILDESDGEVASFLLGKGLGYAGVSSKNCKGFYKAMINRARCAEWNAAEGGSRYFMSAEDLTTMAGISVQQDLALVNLLGLGHVERNGHHFIDGMKGRPEGEQRAFQAAHSDLYRRERGTTRLTITRGEIALGSLACPGFAVGAEMEWSALEPMPKSKWSLS